VSEATDPNLVRDRLFAVLEDDAASTAIAADPSRPAATGRDLAGSSSPGSLSRAAPRSAATRSGSVAPAPVAFGPVASEASSVGPPGSGPGSSMTGPAGGLTALGAFDPGRRGVKALAAVAAVVVLVAAVLAWRARPSVDPVAALPEPVAAVEAPGTAATPTGPPGEVVVAVAGKVRRPGLVRLPAGARVADALHAAGGAKAGADPALLNLARKVVDGELILVGVTPPPGAPAAAGPAAGPAGAAPGGPVNLNTATLADLDTLPGVGPVLAQRILDHREQHGGFASVGDLRKVDGIGSSRYEQLKDLVTV
jgi:competence protein ComEA